MRMHCISEVVDPSWEYIYIYILSFKYMSMFASYHPLLNSNKCLSSSSLPFSRTPDLKPLLLTGTPCFRRDLPMVVVMVVVICHYLSSASLSDSIHVGCSRLAGTISLINGGKLSILPPCTA
jgi:hypothetical protein